MPAQILVTRMPRPDIQKKIAELQADDILEIVDSENPKVPLVRCKIPVAKRGPELDRGYAALQAISDADSAIGRERQKAREAKEKAAAAAAEAAKPKPAAAGAATPKKPGPQG